MLNKILKWFFEFVLRRRIGLKKGPIGENIKWYESENIWAGIVVGLYGVYEIVRDVSSSIFGNPLPPVPESVLGYLSALLGGGIVWSRYTAVKKIN